MAQSGSNRAAGRIAFFLYSLALFHLPAGRIVYSLGEMGEIKVGSSLENLLPIILLARLLWKGLDFSEWRGATAPLREPLFLLFGGLAVGCAASAASAAWEDWIRLLGQAACGFLLAEWIRDSWRDNGYWFLGLVLGFLWLGWMTPWREIGVPALEGPFGHRNTQSAFLILSFPLFYHLFRQPTPARKLVQSFALIVFVAGLAFILVSKSRAGSVGVLVTIIALGFLAVPKVGNGSFKRAAMVGTLGVVFALVALVFLTPRFSDFAQEMANPYHQSRTAIWAAAVQEWRNPSAFVVGSGMGETFDRVLIDSPTGNLNFTYRRTLHPHCLYLQWIVWGGVLASCGWFLTLAGIWKLTRVEDRGGLRIILAACLFGFAASEMFESVLRFSRVAVIFFLDLALLLFIAHSHTSGRGVAERPEEAR